MAPELHFQLLVSLSDTTHYDAPSAEGAPVAIRPTDADASASAESLTRVQDLIESLGGRYGRRVSYEYSDPPQRMLKTQVEKLLGEFDDGVVGRSFVQGVWPIAEGWLRNKELRTFRVKYGDDVLTLGAPGDVEQLLELLKDAVPAPKKKAKPARKAKGKAAGKAKAGAKKKAQKKTKASGKPSAKPKGKARKPAAKAKKARKASKTRR